MDGRVNGNLNLSRSLGDLEFKKDEKLKQEDQMITCFPEVQEQEINSESKFIILACDGV